MKLALKKPVKVGEFPAVTEFTFREEIVAGDLRGITLKALSDMPSEDMLKLIGRLCGQPDPVVAKLSVADFLAMSEVVYGFLGSGLETGATPSPS